MTNEEICNALVQTISRMESGDSQKAELERLRQLVAKLPEVEAPYARAYLAYQDYNAFVPDRSKDVAPYLAAYAASVSQSLKAPISCDELVETFIRPFGNFYAFQEVGLGYCSGLAEAFAQKWPKSAVVYTLRGLEEMHHTRVDDRAIKYFSDAVAIDKDYWLAALQCAELLLKNNRFTEARECCLKLAGAQSAYAMPDNLNLNTANYITAESWRGSAMLSEWITDYAAAEKYYRLSSEIETDEFLSCDTKYSLARVWNKQGQVAKAKAAFKELHERGWIKEARDLGWIVDETFGSEQMEMNWSRGLAAESDLEDKLEAKIEAAIKATEKVFGRNIAFEKPVWRQVRTENGTGIIDLLVKDVDENVSIVLELKRAQVTLKAIKQVSLYLDGVKGKKPRKHVIGILCGYSIPKNVVQSLQNIRDYEIEAWEYRFEERQLFLKRIHPANVDEVKGE